MVDANASIEAIAALQEQVRRDLYCYVTSQAQEVSRGEAADACGVHRSLAAFHLDKLVEVGLLEVTYRRLTERSGPGAGRPAKLYRRTVTEHHVSLPPRSYETAALLLAEATEQAGADSQTESVARRFGERTGMGEQGSGSDLEAVAEVLGRHGYEPHTVGQQLRLRNCPFDSLARQSPPLVCGMNLALLQGLLDGLKANALDVVMDPRPGECCVAVVSKNK